MHNEDDCGSGRPRGLDDGVIAPRPAKFGPLKPATRKEAIASKHEALDSVEGLSAHELLLWFAQGTSAAALAAIGEQDPPMEMREHRLLVAIIARQQDCIDSLETKVRELGGRLGDFGNASIGIAQRIQRLERRGAVMEDEERAEASEAIDDLHKQLLAMQERIRAAGLEPVSWLDDERGGP